MTPRQADLDAKTAADDCDQSQRHDFQEAHTAALQRQQKKRVSCRDGKAPNVWQTEEQLEKEERAIIEERLKTSMVFREIQKPVRTSVSP